jgi:hypothetical protein
MTIATEQVMKLAMAMSLKIGGGKVQLRQELHEQRRRREVAKAWSTFRGQLAAGARLVFILLFVAALLVFVLDHQTTIQRSVEANVSRVATGIVNASQPSRIRQSTLAHEQEVDAITR